MDVAVILLKTINYLLTENFLIINYNVTHLFLYSHVKLTLISDF